MSRPMWAGLLVLLWAIPAAAGLDVTVDMPEEPVFIGKPVTVLFTLQYAQGTKTYFPLHPSVHPFVLLDHERDESLLTGDANLETHRLKLLPVRTGELRLGPIDIPYVAPSGEVLMAQTPEVLWFVGSTLGNEASPTLADAGQWVPVRVYNTFLIWLLSGLGLALVVAAVTVWGVRAYQRYRLAHRPLPPPRPPHEVALERLDALDVSALVEAGRFSELALEISEITREFLGGTFGFSGVEMTSWEVMQALEGQDLHRANPLEIDDLLSFCDLLKFAKLLPSVTQAHGLLRRGRELVEQIYQPPKPEPEPADSDQEGGGEGRHSELLEGSDAL